MTRAEFARIVARHARDMAVTSADLADGMWNPDFCAADAARDAKILMQDLRYLIERIEAKLDRDAR